MSIIDKTLQKEYHKLITCVPIWEYSKSRQKGVIFIKKVGGFMGVWPKGVKMSHISDDREHEKHRFPSPVGGSSFHFLKKRGTMTPVSLI